MKIIKQKKKLIALVLVLFLVLGSAVILNKKYFHFGAEIELAIPKSPSDLFATESTDKKITYLKWTDNATNENGFKVERTINIVSGFAEIAQVRANISSYPDQVNPNQRYYYRVRAYNSLGNSGYSEISTPTRIEKIDFLLGQGDFETPIVSKWTTYDNDNRRYLTKWEWAGKDNELANGWGVYYDALLLNKEQNIVARNDKGTGVDGSNAQYFGIKNYNGPSAQARIGKAVNLGNIDDLLESGDKLVFTLDKIELIDSANLPVGAAVSHYFYYELTAKDIDGNAQEITGSKILSGSSLSEEIAVPDNFVANLALSASFNTQVSGDLMGYEAGLEIDSAHLFVKNRANNDKTWIIPAPKNRTILTHANYYSIHSLNKNLYWIAEHTDYLSISDSEYSFIPTLKAINPNIKVFIYEAPNMTDWRIYYPERTGNKYEVSIFGNSSINFIDALDNHQNWFKEYADNTGPLEVDDRGVIFGDNRKEELKYNNDGETKLNYVFSPYYQNAYAANLSADFYKETWAANTANILRKLKADGVFSDGPGVETIYGTYTDPVRGTKRIETVFEREAYIAQDFAAYVFNNLRNQGFASIQNAAGNHYDTWPGRAYLNPFWDRTKEIPGQNGTPVNFDASDYQDASRENTTDFFFNEEALIKINWRDHNDYNLQYWLDSLQDMDALLQWNTQDIPSNLKKRLMQHVIYYDRPDLNDPADGLDGSIRFGLTSFLLGASEYASLSFEKGIPNDKQFKGDWYNLNIDFSITQKLGEPLGAKEELTALYPDKSLQVRKFDHGTIVVNGHPTLEREYTLSQNMVDEDSKTYPVGYKLVLKPHSGRIFFLPPTPPTPTPGKSSKPSPTPTSIQTVTPSPTPNPTDEQTPLPSEDQSFPPEEIPPLVYQTPTSQAQNTNPSSLPGISPTPARSPENGINAPKQQSSPATTKIASKKSKYITWILVILGLIIAFEVVFILVKNRKEKL